MYSILFICSANICRSPMAEGLFQIKVRGQTGPWRIESAGVWGMDGSPAADNTLRVLLKRGIDLSSHLARQVTLDLASQFNLILTMERGHKEALNAAMPQISRRVFVLSEMAGKAYDIPDPIGGDVAEFEDTARELERIFERGWERICQLAGG